VATVYNQTVSCRFGVELNDLLENDYWTYLDVGVAWVRRSGMRHIMPSLTNFLQRGGKARFVVGVDIENSSKEGLEDLLSQAQYGQIHTFIHHNEHASATFHPKVYLFHNEEHAKLIVGSNNLTQSGLFTNTEAGLEIDGTISDSVIVAIRAALDSWCEPSQGLSHELDAAFLTSLEQGGYVHSEKAINRRRAAARPSRARRGTARPPLFGSRPQAAPPLPGAVDPQRQPEVTPDSRPQRRRRRPSSAPTSGVGTLLLIRPRLARGTQMQIPIPLKKGPFLNTVNEIVSDHDDVPRPINPTHPERAGGAVNTYKMELPESHDVDNPVMRIWKTPEGRVRYRVYDPDSPDGLFILQRLEGGRRTNPPQTTVTKRNDPDHSTWYRFV